MNIKTVEEECKDTSIGTIEDEIEMFFWSKAGECKGRRKISI